MNGCQVHAWSGPPKLGTSQSRELWAVEWRGDRGFKTRLRSHVSVFMAYSLCWASQPHLCNKSGFHYSAISFLVPDSQGNVCLHLPLQPVSWWGSTASSFKSCWDVRGGGREGRAFWAPPSAKLAHGSRMEAFYLCAQQRLLYSLNLSS